MNNIENTENKKQINITGQTNRYQIKKLTQEKKTDKKRVEIQKLNLFVEYFTYDKQLQLINDLNNDLNNENNTELKILIKHSVLKDGVLL